uniref:Uncharacterized protein n=1 Tax=Sphaerodactylus townsendi TaxID=933632 RepID=A0ACB8G9Q9_9SAUR
MRRYGAHTTPEPIRLIYAAGSVQELGDSGTEVTTSRCTGVAFAASGQISKVSKAASKGRSSRHKHGLRSATCRAKRFTVSRCSLNAATTPCSLQRGSPDDDVRAERQGESLPPIPDVAVSRFYSGGHTQHSPVSRLLSYLSIPSQVLAEWKL